MHRSLLVETSHEPKFLHIRETTESTKERTESSLIRDSVLTVETVSLDDIDQPNFVDFPQDNISLKMRLLARTGRQAPESSLISVLTTRESVMSSHKLGFNSLIYEKSDHCYPVKTARNSKSKEISFMGEFWRTDDEMRRGYLDRLRGSKVIGPNLKKKHQSVVIADWDGVLFCGSDLEDLKSNQSTQAEKETLALLDKSISTLLAKAADFCPTFIITSYAETFVESRSRIFLPSTFEVIKSRKIEIVSIGNYTLKESQEMKKGWFYIKDKLDSTVGTNIMYVVDSQTKVDMINCLKDHCGNPLIKIVKFKEYPKVNELIKQQRLLINEFENILFSLRSFTVHLAKKAQKK